MTEELTVPVFKTFEGGERVQVGKATPAVDGVRSVKLFKKYDGVSKKDLIFLDDEALPASPVEDAPDAEQAAQPVDASVDPLNDDSTSWVDANPEVPVEDFDEDSVDDVEDVPEELEPAPAVSNDEDDDQ